MIQQKLSKMNERQWKFLLNVAKLIQFAEKNGMVLTGGELHRTQDQQDIYLKKGMTKVKTSQHMKRLAIDLMLFIDGVYQTTREPYKPLADYWKTLDPANRSGYDWGWDANHFEMQ